MDKLLGDNSENVIDPIPLPELKRSVKSFKYINKRNIPASVDWRKKGVVNPIRDQGKCGSCWTFASVAAIESQYARVTGNLLQLSEQNLLNCGKAYFTPSDSNGCNGGQAELGFNWVKANKGINLRTADPYTASYSGRCTFNSTASGVSDVRVDGWVSVPADENIIAATIAQYGPVAASIYANKNYIFAYSGGVYTDPTYTNQKVNHAIVIDGYDTDPVLGPYWIVRNSWGLNCGDNGNGYWKILRGKNMINIASDVKYPLVSNKRTPPPATTYPTFNACSKGSPDGFYAYPGCKRFVNSLSCFFENNIA